MRWPRFVQAAVGFVLVSSLLSACLFGAPPSPPRYFRPELPSSIAVERSGGNGAAPLQFYRVTSADHLNQQMVWRNQVEFGFYRSRRWTEPPGHYLEQLLARELFEVRQLRRATGGIVPILKVELLAFEEVLTPNHEALVELRVLLVDARHVSLLERTFTVTRPIESRDPASFTRAAGQALFEAVQQVAEEIVAVLPPADA